MNSIRATILSVLLLACANSDDTATIAADTGAALVCSTPETVAALPRSIREASGIAPSRTAPGHFWVHNDSEGEPALYALDARGTVVARVTLPSVDQVDWEDIATAPCGDGDCIYIADIGDNFHRRADIAILRFPEPPLRDGEVSHIERFPLRYPDGAHDAEAVFVLPDGRLYLITKGRDTAVAVYRYPGSLRPGTVTLERIQQLTPGIVQMPDMVTGAASSPDGTVVAIRTYSGVQLYRLDADSLARVGSASLAAVREPQGEGIAIGDNGELMLVSEMGPILGAAPLTRIRCQLPR